MIDLFYAKCKKVVNSTLLTFVRPNSIAIITVYIKVKVTVRPYSASGVTLSTYLRCQAIGP